LFTFGAALVAPRSVIAQRTQNAARIGVLRLADMDTSKRNLEFFKRGLRELGYSEGSNLALELRFADGKAERLPALAAELIELRVDVIVATDTPSTRAAQQATSTIPIVMANIIDPVGSGFVASLARPGKNITGLSNMSSDVSPKYVELLTTIVPKLSRIAVLLNPVNSAHRGTLRSIEAAAKEAGLKVLPLEAESPQQIESAFAAISKERAGAVIVAQDAFLAQQRRQIAALALKGRVPSISGVRDLTEAGALISYGQDPADSWRRSADYVDKILKGAKASDLPVQQAATFELVINVKTARGLGLTIPQAILTRADRVIE
jgi:putative ABC transport system substrate-binding protein